MKKIPLVLLFIILGYVGFTQDIHFPPAIVAAGGSSEEGTITLSRWRLAPIHVITLPNANFKGKDSIGDVNWSVSIYPNPVEDFLYLEFQLQDQREFILKIADAAGRIIFLQEARTFINGSINALNVSSYTPAIYLLQVTSPDLTSQRVYRFQKY